INYKNPNTYLEGLINIKDVKKTSDITIAKNKYKLYDVTINKKYINKVINETSLKFTGEKDCTAEIYIDSNKRVYKVIYTIEGIKIAATYYDINNIKGVKHE
ncbi:MAG TPA: hypothetical protein PKY25_03545, partial [Bacilli bacterium]|nr:hypothetical protein [Bacilli bacterium]